MDDRRLNPLRLLLVGIILSYFVWLIAVPDQPVPDQPGTPATSVAGLRSQVAGHAPAPVGCYGHIQTVTFDDQHVRLQITGAGDYITVFTPYGNQVVRTIEAGSAGEYHIHLAIPGPPTALRLDGCPVLKLR